MTQYCDYVLNFELPRKYIVDPHRGRKLKGFPTSCELRMVTPDSVNSLNTVSGTAVTVSITDILHEGEHSTVYLGTLIDAEGHPIEVALKFGDTKRQVEAEAAMYNSLRSVQGIAIPRLYGILAGSLKSGAYWAEPEMTCLVLERFGDTLPDDVRFCYMSLPDRACILDKLLKTHQAGVRHCEFKEEYVLQKVNDDGSHDYRIIHWLDTIPHNCGCQFDFLKHTDVQVECTEDLKCLSMDAQSRHFHYWASDILIMMGGSVIVMKSSVTDMPTQDIIDTIGEPLLGIGFDELDFTRTQAERDMCISFYRMVQKRLSKNGNDISEVQRLKSYLVYQAHKKWHLQ
ncbi:hypothetical protein EUX98_g9785, partial [Antrodiella citrinella]